MVLEHGLEADKQIMVVGAQREVIVAGMAGNDLSTGERMVYISADTPQQVRQPLDKQAAELLDVQRFLAHEYPNALVEVRPGPQPNQPPDVMATVNHEELHVEAAQLLAPASSAASKQLTSPSRWREFTKTREELMRRCRPLSSRLRRHRGTVVHVWYASPETFLTGTGLPSLKTGPDDTIALLSSVAPPPPPPWRIGLPASAGPGSVAWNADQTIGVTWADLPAGYASTFFALLGFELALVHGQAIRLADARGELRRIVEQHDTAAADVLVVSTNTALRSGLYFPSSKFVADMLFDDVDPLGAWSPANIARVALHDPDEPGHVRWVHGDPWRPKS